MKVTFHEVVQDSQEYGSNDEHIGVARVLHNRGERESVHWAMRYTSDRLKGWHLGE
jgi:hypothetical protein